MPITLMSSRDFNQDTSGAKKAAANGPVFITDRGKPAHVLLNMDEYQRLTQQHQRIGELLAMPKSLDTELPLPPREERAKPIDLS